MLKPPKPKIDEEEFDEHFRQAVEVVCQYDRVSPALLQRRISVGYARAARLIDLLEKAGVVGPAIGAKPREDVIFKPNFGSEVKVKF